MKSEGGEKSQMHSAVPENNEQKSYEGFEGMNYEQIRQHYKYNFKKGTTSSGDSTLPKDSSKQ